MKLFEVFNSGEKDFEVILNTSNKWVATKTLSGDRELVFKATKNNNEWEILFSVNDEVKVTNKSHDGNYVLGTVINMFEAFEADIDPSIIYFTGDEQHAGVYKLMARRLVKLGKWIDRTDEQDSIYGVTHFRMHKKLKFTKDDVTVKVLDDWFIAEYDEYIVELQITPKTNRLVEITNIIFQIQSHDAYDELKLMIQQMPSLQNMIYALEDALKDKYAKGATFIFSNPDWGDLFNNINRQVKHVDVEVSGDTWVGSIDDHSITFRRDGDYWYADGIIDIGVDSELIINKFTHDVEPDMFFIDRGDVTKFIEIPPTSYKRDQVGSVFIYTVESFKGLAKSDFIIEKSDSKLYVGVNLPILGDAGIEFVKRNDMDCDVAFKGEYGVREYFKFLLEVIKFAAIAYVVSDWVDISYVHASDFTERSLISMLFGDAKFFD